MTYWLNEEWTNPDYQKRKQENFDVLAAELKHPPTTLLDIGCGLAWESRLFNKHYNTELWLLDGDSKDNENKPSNAKDVNYHNTSDEFLFYHPLSVLHENLKRLGLTNYKLVDCNNIDIPDDKKFDIITSWLSCGFHYPASTYRNLILKHSHENTRVFMDIRTHVKTGEPFLEEGVEIVKILSRHKKVINAEIKFV